MMPLGRGPDPPRTPMPPSLRSRSTSRHWSRSVSRCHRKPPWRPVPDVVQILPAAEEIYGGATAFWTRRHMRRWQIGLLR